MHALNPALAENSYLASFPHARRIKRHHHFYLGPTNSGKTHQALLALQQAESGVYLAPLRLLAMEIRDRLVAAGVPCNLITGEERVSEIARMLGGEKLSATTLAHAREMLTPAATRQATER